jgi:hypothetical protein
MIPLSVAATKQRNWTSVKSSTGRNDTWTGQFG